MTHARLIAFLFGCIGTRAAITYVAKTAPLAMVRTMGYVALLPAIGFTIIYVGKLRKTGVEVGGGRIWWDALRPVHAALLFSFAYFAIHAQRRAWMFLLADTMLGFTATALHHLR